MGTIISEMLESAERGNILESGRTACGNGRQILGPQSRHPTSVNLNMCPFGTGGAWHTHVTPDEVRNPRNSLPDISNVVFGLLDVMIVTGTQSTEAFIRPTDNESLQHTFNNTLGIEARSPQDVTEAILDGRIHDLRSAGDRVRNELSPLFVREYIQFPNLDQWADTVMPMGASPFHEPEASQMDVIDAMVMDYENAVASSHNIHEACRSINTKMKENAELVSRLTQDVDMRSLVIANVIGTIVGVVTTRVLFSN